MSNDASVVTNSGDGGIREALASPARFAPDSRPMLALALLVALTGVAEAGEAGEAAESGGEASDPSYRLSGYLQFHYKARIDADGDGKSEPDRFRVQRAR